MTELWPNPIKKIIGPARDDQGTPSAIVYRDDVANPYANTPGPVMYYDQSPGHFKNEYGYTMSADYMEVKAQYEEYK